MSSSGRVFLFPNYRGAQIDLWDRFNSLPPKAQEEIKEDYGVYYYLLQRVSENADPFVQAMPEKFRVSRQLIVMMIMLFFLQCHDGLTAEGAIRNSHRDIGYQYVLRATGGRPEFQISRSVYFEFLAHVLYHEAETGENLFVNLSELLSDEIASLMGFNLHKEIPGYVLITRMDSMMIETPAEVRGRVGIIYRTVHLALRYLAMCEGLARIPEELHHFLDSSDENIVTYHNKDTQTEKLTVILQEAEEVLALFGGEEKATDIYVCLRRVIEEQGTRNEAGELIPRPNKEIKGGSMQSPDYPEATARTKNRVTHIGEAVNFCEACDGKGHSVIHHVSLKPNIYSDPQFILDYIAQKKPDSPMEVVVTDGAYITPETLEAAVAKGIILIATSMPGIVPKVLYSEFVLSDNGKDIASCPAGHAPLPDSAAYNEETGVITAKFDLETCKGCSKFESCPVKEQKKACRLDISQKVIDRAEIYSNFSSEEHSAFSRIRNGVESIPSVMRRRYDIDHMDTRRPALRRAKLLGYVLSYNVLKFARFQKEKEQLAGINRLQPALI